MKQKTRTMTRAAIMIALATTLSFFKVMDLPTGGSITLGSMIPIVLISYMMDFKGAILTSFVYSLLQMMLQGIATPPTENFMWYMLVILLDYVIAYTVLGLAGTLTRKISNITVKVISGSVIVLILRFICHFISGILIWGVYAPEGQSIYLYSLLYNGSYMLGELIITVIIISLIVNASFIKREIK